MKITRHTDLAAFWAQVEPLFRADPLRNTIALTVLRGLVAAPDPDAEPPLLLTIDPTAGTAGKAGEAGAAFCTPPWPMGVSCVPDAAMPDLVRYLRDIAFPVTGVSAPLEKADLFADTWLAAAGGTKELAIALRLYLLDELTPPDVPGEARRATEDDVELLARWREAFAGEAAPHNEARRDQTVPVRRSMATGNGNLLWYVDDEPVSHAAASRPIGGMSRIGPVYTPPEHRNHGYASAITAAAARWALDAGADKVALFTDLANPTSNAIYQRIGFRPHHDAVEYRFISPPTTT
ncbi:GNAT family N-acetyltransferase [Labedaea rhizosphaerae]|uniref:Putative GNAT family acetyltransferase n=1 Tax=Labedaea rhizosphaerae TaxID=598644 RepID=A0A4R6RQK7_LABRH|nr:GNAT family N-acetyltransferase [Labedaea rhizosphaerae]TDP89079.1 putative GNAT family acetyltransferase [Labedaea rhizosphaerae]